MIDKNELKLSDEINHHFVRGLVNGYERYLQVRVAAAEDMVISNGYAYTRGNHLEDMIAKEESANVQFEHAKAGSWSYLKFKVHNSENNHMIIVRRAERINETLAELQSKTLENREKNWLYGLSKINNRLELDKIVNNSKVQQLKLYADNAIDERAIIRSENLSLNLEEEFDGFYILTYEIDSNTQELSDADLMMMDSKTLGLVQVESLRGMMLEYQASISIELFRKAQKAISPLEIAAEAVEYGVAVAGDTEDYASEATQKEDVNQEE
ncbi:hypothetical protein GCM10008932_17280 [Alkalibacterium iburiense]|uniref:Uncharacterized protein n=1 Tax=Alkalibacterium iburiense TaxID=290589 RepID=A0ABN0XJ56_9LACT